MLTVNPKATWLFTPNDEQAKTIDNPTYVPATFLLGVVTALDKIEAGERRNSCGDKSSGTNIFAWEMVRRSLRGWPKGVDVPFVAESGQVYASAESMGVLPLSAIRQLFTEVMLHETTTQDDVGKS